MFVFGHGSYQHATIASHINACCFQHDIVMTHVHSRQHLRPYGSTKLTVVTLHPAHHGQETPRPHPARGM
jgi:hypothetical protein